LWNKALAAGARAAHGNPDLEAAISEYRQAISLKPDYASWHDQLAIALRDRGDSEGEVAEYRAVLRLRPDDAWAHWNLAQALDAKGEKQAALEEFRKASELDPGNKHFREDYQRLSIELKR
jgi:Flp pilus assembly protein TadD